MGQESGSDLLACQRCGSSCCMYFCLEIDGPRSRADFENIRWYVCHERTRVYRQDGKWHLLVENRCKSLDHEGRCSMYPTRPTLCREYDPKKCEGSGDFEFDLLFDSPEQVDAYVARRFSGKRRGRPDTAGRYRAPRNAPPKP